MEVDEGASVGAEDATAVAVGGVTTSWGVSGTIAEAIGDVAATVATGGSAA
jgi:hypothetical protein